MKRRDLLSMVAAGVAVRPAFAQETRPPLSRTLNAAEWREDLRFLFAQLKQHHRNLFHHTPAVRFEEAIAQLDRQIPSMKPLAIVAGIQAIVALAGDGHSFVFARDLYRTFPFEAAWFGDEVRIIRTTAAARHLLGMRIDRIDGMPMREVASRLNRTIAQAENRWYVLGQLPDRLRRAELLEALGVIKSAERMTLTGISAGGGRVVEAVSAAPHNAKGAELSEALGPKVPDRPYPSLAWHRLAGADAVHLNFRSYEAFAERAAQFLAEMRATLPRVLLIDLRRNSGGNYTLPRKHLIEPIQELSALNRRGRLYVLVGRHTFSAAMVNAIDLRRETEALLVGEPIGARPNGYQELYSFTLPHSGLRVACSIRSYRFDDANRDAVPPDIDAAPSWPEFYRGSDPAITAALASARSR